MANASVDMNTVKNAQILCNEAIEVLNSSVQKLNNRYRDAGQQWRDEKYKQLGNIVSDCSRALKSPLEELRDCLAKLKELEKSILEYNGQKI